jgi:hypothetical protein
MRKMSWLAIPVGGFFAFMLVVMVLFGTGISTAPDQVAVWYKAGPVTSTRFDHCVHPGTRQIWGGVLDKTYKYPAGQRTYKFVSEAGSKDADGRGFTVLTKDNIELQVEGVARFTLNTTCSKLRAFHEQIGIKYEAHMDGDQTSDGWRSMLDTYLRQALQRSLNEATADYEWKSLYSTNLAKKEWESEVARLLPRYVKQAMGDAYFGSYALTIQKPTLPHDLVEALEATQVAIQQNNAQKQRNATVQTEVESLRSLIDALGPDGYAAYRSAQVVEAAIKSGRVTVLPVPSGSPISIPTH